MSYGIMPYRVSLDRVRSRFGCSVSSKRSKIKKACARYASQIDEWDDENTPKMMEIVEELLDGKATHSNLGYKYWYALKGFIEDLGRFMMNREWYPADADAFWDIEEFRLYDIDAPMKIPRPDDFPTVFVLRSENMTPDLDLKLQQKLSGGQLIEVQGWIREAKQYKQDIILYYH
jgi:hypothetical protein